MSKLSKGLHKLVKNPITQGFGKALDIGSNYLPPGFRDAGHVAGGLLQNKNLKTSMKDAALSYVGGKVMGSLGGKFGAKVPGAAGAGKSSGDLMTKFSDPSSLTAGMKNVAGAGVSNYGKDMGMAGKLAGAAKNFGGAAVAGLASGAGTGGSTASIDGMPENTKSKGGNDWRSALRSPGVVEAGIGLAGSALAGYGQGKTADKDRQWEKEKFGREQVVPEGQAAMGAQNSLDSAPMRDRAMYMLTQRMGTPQQSFVPHDIFNPSYGSGPAQMGGYNQDTLNQQQAAYTPGAGGVSTNVQKMLMQKLGYGPPGAGAPPPGGPPQGGKPTTPIPFAPPAQRPGPRPFMAGRR